MTDSLATHRARMPSGTERFLDARSLPGAHGRLAELTRGHQVVADGFLTEARRAAAEADFIAWAAGAEQSQTMSLRTVEGVAPGD